MSIRNMYNSFNIQLDPYWDKVVSLLHFEGTSVYDTIVDEKGNNWTKYNVALLSDDNKKFGARSLLFTEDSPGYIQSSSNKYSIGLNDFCIEFFFNASHLVGDKVLFHLPYTIGGANYNLFLKIQGAYISLEVGSYDPIYTTIYSNTWYHVAVVRNNYGYLHLYLDGTLIGSFQFYDSVNSLSSTNVYIGAIGGNTYNFYGYIDEFRFTNGKGRYISDFSPPTAPFPNF